MRAARALPPAHSPVRLIPPPPLLVLLLLSCTGARAVLVPPAAGPPPPPRRPPLAKRATRVAATRLLRLRRLLPSAPAPPSLTPRGSRSRRRHHRRLPQPQPLPLLLLRQIRSSGGYTLDPCAVDADCIAPRICEIQTCLLPAALDNRTCASCADCPGFPAEVCAPDPDAGVTCISAIGAADLMLNLTDGCEGKAARQSPNALPVAPARPRPGGPPVPGGGGSGGGTIGPFLPPLPPAASATARPPPQQQAPGRRRAGGRHGEEEEKEEEEEVLPSLEPTASAEMEVPEESPAFTPETDADDADALSPSAAPPSAPPSPKPLFRGGYVLDPCSTNFDCRGKRVCAAGACAAQRPGQYACSSCADCGGAPDEVCTSYPGVGLSCVSAAVASELDLIYAVGC